MLLEMRYPSQGLPKLSECPDVNEKLLTGNVRIIDFGDAFFVNNPRAGFLGTAAAYYRSLIRKREVGEIVIFDEDEGIWADHVTLLICG
jgi:hypothetical protein